MKQTELDFERKTNYSFETSLPPYKEFDRENQEKRVLSSIERGNNCLLSISEDLKMPQSTVAGRVNDLKVKAKIYYDDFVLYKGRKRKKINIL